MSAVSAASQVALAPPLRAASQQEDAVALLLERGECRGGACRARAITNERSAGACS